MTRSRLLAAGLATALAILFFVWHSSLLSPEGRVRGFNSDAAVIALMGKKMLEGRGFDIFFWGQNYVGPLTSMFIAAAGVFVGAVDPLAMRIGAFVEVLGGLLLMAWGMRRIDGRAAVLTAIALSITPPILLRMMVNPLGAEMAFFCASALFAIVAQHATAPPGRGWLSHRAAQFAFGVFAALSWWMNQQVVFTLIAAGALFAMRSRIATAVLREIRIGDRLMLRKEALGWSRVPGVVEALAWLMTRAGLILFAAFVVLDVAGQPGLPFVFGRATDALLLIFVPLIVMPFAFGEWRRWRLPVDRDEISAAIRFLAGFALGYAPVWLGRILGWYAPAYSFSFQLNTPGGAAAMLAVFVREVLPQSIGMTSGPIGIVFGVALLGLATAGAARAPMDVRLLLALPPLGNFAFFLFAHGARPHYFIASIGILYGLAAFGAVTLWDSGRLSMRIGIAVVAAIAFASMADASSQLRRDVLAEPDPRPLLDRVRAAQCAVCYADYWIAYRYRLLDGESRAWIPHLSLNRTPEESLAYQRRPGQRCLIARDGTVTRIGRDRPLVHPRPRP